MPQLLQDCFLAHSLPVFGKEPEFMKKNLFIMMSQYGALMSRTGR